MKEDFLLLVSVKLVVIVKPRRQPIKGLGGLENSRSFEPLKKSCLISSLLSLPFYVHVFELVYSLCTLHLVFLCLT